MKLFLTPIILVAIGVKFAQAEGTVQLWYHTNFENPQDGWQEISVSDNQAGGSGYCFSNEIGSNLNDRIHSAAVTGDIHCVFWANKGCSGRHTNMLYGPIPDFNHVCGGGWQKIISSFKCCSGIDNSWCKGGRAADCT